MRPSAFIAHTHTAWFDNLSAIAERDGAGALRLDEVNSWSPRSTAPIKHFAPGEPVFFRLGASAPHGARHVVGHGFFADHLPDISVQLAWELFGPKNGAPTLGELARHPEGPHRA